MQSGRRQSIRLPGYNYASEGWYFVTICCKDHSHLSGEIRDGEMVLQEAGDWVEKWWNKIPEKSPDIELGDYDIMPNYFHAIVINVGANPCLCLAGRRVGLSLPVTPDSLVNQQQTNINLSSWGGNGIYYLHLINPQGIAVEIKKIVMAP